MQTNYGEGIRSFLTTNKNVCEIVNFGDQQVFDEPITYTMLLFIKKRINKEYKYTHVKNLKQNLNQLKLTRENNDYQDSDIIVELKENNLNSEPWVFTSKETEDLFERLNKIDKFEAIYDRLFQGFVTGADKVFVVKRVEKVGTLFKVFSLEKNQEYVLERDMLKPLLKGSEIKRWVVESHNNLAIFPYLYNGDKYELLDASIFEKKYPRTWNYLNENKVTLESREKNRRKDKENWYEYSRPQNLNQFPQPKILMQVLSKKGSFSLDLEKKYYFVGGGTAGGYGITIKEGKQVSLNYLCGLLNSLLINWFVSKISSPFKGGFWSYGQNFSKRLPIITPQGSLKNKLIRKIEELVQLIIKLQKTKNKSIKFWEKISCELKTGKYTLNNLLIKEESITEKNKKWTSNILFKITSKNNILEKKYSTFRIYGDPSSQKLKFFGLMENMEELLYEIAFNTRELMIHVYFSIMATLNSRKKIKSLKDIIEKTEIFIIKGEVAKNTVKIINTLTNSLKIWIEKKNFSQEIPIDIIKIDNKINDIEANINAHIFKLYDLNEKEIDLVMNSTNTQIEYYDKILSIFKRI